jgi:FkbM family methyltransferase
MDALGIDTVLDVGAHAGEFGQSIRHAGYRGRIASFEPVSAHYKRLLQVADADDAWTCRKVAVGESASTAEIYVSGNDGFSSSIREMAPAHEKADPESSYVDSEQIDVISLDEALAEMPGQTGPLMLKVDTQGFEEEVLSGAVDTLGRCRLVELELALVELYNGQALFGELVNQMHKRGFLLADVESGFRDPRTSQLLQVDGLFISS